MAYYKAILGKQWCGAMLLWGNKVRLVDTVEHAGEINLGLGQVFEQA